jgi:hypothetical protein
MARAQLLRRQQFFGSRETRYGRLYLGIESGSAAPGIRLRIDLRRHSAEADAVVGDNIPTVFMRSPRSTRVSNFTGRKAPPA